MARTMISRSLLRPRERGNKKRRSEGWVRRKVWPGEGEGALSFLFHPYILRCLCCLDVIALVASSQSCCALSEWVFVIKRHACMRAIVQTGFAQSKGGQSKKRG